MFCWPRSRGSSSSRKKSKSSDLSTVVDDEKSLAGGNTGGILVKPYKPRKKGKTATFKCDLSEALLPPSEECLINRSASCNSSIRELSYHRGSSAVEKGTSNKHFVSSQTSGFGEESDSVNNNNRKNGGSVASDNRSAKVLLYYSNNSLSTRNSLADFIENEDFNYKSLWGKDITEWDSRESRCQTLERKVAASNESNKTAVTLRESKSTSRNITEKRLSGAASSPSLSTTCNLKKTGKKPFSEEDNEPLPSPPPTPPEAKAAKNTGLKLKTSNYFKYPDTSSSNDKSLPPEPFRIHSSTSTSSLSSSCILTNDTVGRTSPSECTTSVQDSDKSANERATQTLPFWQLEFPGILYCTTCRNRNSHDSGTIFNSCGSGEGGVILQQQLEDGSTPLLILATQGHESPGGDSSSGISSSDDNLESLQTPDEEAMLKSLKNSFLNQAIPFQLCNFSINSGGVGTTANSNNVITSAHPNSSNWNALNLSQQCQSIITNELSSALCSNKVIDQNFKNQHHQPECHLQSEKQSYISTEGNKDTDKCDQQLAEDIPSVTNQQGLFK